MSKHKHGMGISTYECFFSVELLHPKPSQSRDVESKL